MSIDPTVNAYVIGLMGAVFGVLMMAMGSLIDARHRGPTTGVMDAAEQGRLAAQSVMQTPAGRLFMLATAGYLIVIAITISYSPLTMRWAWFFGGYFAVPLAGGVLSAFMPAGMRLRLLETFNLRH